MASTITIHHKVHSLHFMLEDYSNNVESLVFRRQYQATATSFFLFPQEVFEDSLY